MSSAAALASVSAASAAPVVAAPAALSADDAPTPVADPAFYAMQSGTIASANGTNGPDGTRIRTAAHAVLDSSWRTLVFDGAADLDVTVFAYDSSGTYLSPSTGWQSLAAGPYSYSVPAGAATLAYVIKYHTVAPLGPADRSPWVQISALGGPSLPEVTEIGPEFYAVESGTIASANGTEGGNGTRIRSQAPVAISSSWQWLKFEGGTDLDITVFAYNGNGGYISPSTGWQSLASGSYTYTVPAGTAKIAYVLKYKTEATINPSDRSPWLQISVVTDSGAPDDSDVFPYGDTALTLVNHRGLAPGYPENTLAAYANAVARQVFAIEIDLRPTSDGQIIVLHDDTVDRTTDGTGAASSLTLAQIKALDAGSYAGAQFAGQRIPTFEEALEAVKGTGVKLLLDIKVDSVVPQVVALTEAHGMAGQVIVGPAPCRRSTTSRRAIPS